MATEGEQERLADREHVTCDAEITKSVGSQDDDTKVSSFKCHYV